MTWRALILCCGLLPAVASPAAAWYVTAGVGGSDVGLHENGTGFDLGVGAVWPAGDGPFEVAAELAYVQRAGSQPLAFTSTTRGLFIDDAAVTLHMARPGVFGGLRLLRGEVVSRVYGGFSAAVKLAESWDRPDGETNRVYGYEDLDAELHVGVSVGVGRMALDFRYNHGLLEQLVDRDADNAGGWTKAADDLEGVAAPEDGATASSWQLGLVVGF